MARSDTSIQALDDELKVNADYAALTDGERLQLIATGIQQVCNLFNDANLPDYRSDNMSGAGGAIVVGAYQSGIILAVPLSGSSVVFTTPFSSNIHATGDYHLDIQPFVIINGHQEKIGYAADKTTTGFTVYPDADADVLTWHATPITQ